MRSLLALLLLAPLAALTAADKPKAAPQAPKKQARPTPPTRAFDAPGKPVETVRDRLWLWGHPPGVFNNQLRKVLGKESTTGPVAAAKDLGIPNVIHIRYRGEPEPPFDGYYQPFRDLKKAYWSLVGAHGATSPEERDQVFQLAEKNPNLRGFILDDFFHAQPRGNATDSLREVRPWLAQNGAVFPVTLEARPPEKEAVDGVTLTQTDWKGGHYRSRAVEVDLSEDGHLWRTVAKGTMPDKPAGTLSLQWPATTVSAARIRVLDTLDQGKDASCGFGSVAFTLAGANRSFGRWRASASSNYPGHEALQAVRGIVPPDNEPLPASLSVAELNEIGRRTVRGESLPVMAVIYTRQIKARALPHLNAVDQLCLWTWRPNDLKNLEANFEALERLVPGKDLFLGCYMYDFHESKPLPVDRMKHQTDLAFQWLREGRIKGIIFLSNGIADVGLESVEWTRRWIMEHGDEKLN
jgi:hypothetical protein